MNNTRTTFEQEVMPLVPALYGMALKYTHSESDAEDLVQESLIKAYRNFDSYDPGTNCKAWLSRILVNTFINKYRHKQRENAFVERVQSEQGDIVEPPIDITNSNTLSNDTLLTKEFLSENDLFYAFSDEVVHALKSISKEFRAIIVLADVLDFSYREISDKLQIPIGTVMSRLSRARQSMRNFLNDYAMKLGY